MADITRSAYGGEFDKNFKDMGDDTHAEVVSAVVDTDAGAGAVIGATTDAAVATDADGTLNAHARGLIKLLVDKISVKFDPITATPTLYNVTLTLANTEYSQAMPASCRRFGFQCRTAYDVRYAIVTGKVAGSTAPYMTLKSGQWYDSGQIAQGASPSTLYLASSTAGVVVEIEAWT